MGALFSSPPSPPPIPVPPPAAAPATMANARNQAAPVNTKAAAGAMMSTVGTAPGGLTAPPKTADTQLLGATQ